MTPSASLLTFVTSTSLGGLALAIIKDIAEACRPTQSVHSNSPCLCQEHPRAVIPLVAASDLPLSVQGQCLLLRKQWSTDPWARASKNPIHFIQGERA